MRVVYKNELTRCSYKCGRRYNIGKGFWVFIFVDVRFSCFIQYFIKWTVLFQNIQSIKISGTHLSKPYFDEHRWSPNPNILNTSSSQKMLNFFPFAVDCPILFGSESWWDIFSQRTIKEFISRWVATITTSLTTTTTTTSTIPPYHRCPFTVINCIIPKGSFDGEKFSSWNKMLGFWKSTFLKVQVGFEAVTFWRQV